MGAQRLYRVIIIFTSIVVGIVAVHANAQQAREVRFEGKITAMMEQENVPPRAEVQITSTLQGAISGFAVVDLFPTGETCQGTIDRPLQVGDQVEVFGFWQFFGKDVSRTVNVCQNAQYYIRKQDDTSEPPANEPPNADFTWNPSNPTAGDNIQFRDQSSDPDGQITSWEWTEGDVIVGTVQNPMLPFKETVNLCLTVEDNDGASDRTCKTVRVRSERNQAPTIDSINIDPQNPRVGQSVSFVVGASDPEGDALSYSWDFGDGSSASGLPMSHRYDSPGSYTVTLRVRDSHGNVATANRTIHVQGEPDRPPNADFTWSPSNPIVGETVQFQDQSSDPEGNLTSWQWRFGDNNSASARNPSHQYNRASDFTVCLTVWDSDEFSDEECKSINVEPEPNQPPNADFSWQPRNPTVDATVNFRDQSSDPDGRVVFRRWEFDDGSTSNAHDPSHSFGQAGSYSVCLTVRDDDGQTDQECQPVSVSEPEQEAPIARLTANPTSGKAPLTVQFDATGSSDPDGRVVRYSWYFGDNASQVDSSQARIEHTYDSPGTYDVELIIADNDDLVDTEIITINVNKESDRQPNASFEYSPDTPSVGESVSFEDTSSDPDGRIVSREWQFPDGSTSSGRTISYTFERADSFSVCLEVEDNDGNTDDFCQPIAVGESEGEPKDPIARLKAEPTSGEAPLTVSFDATASSDPDGRIERYGWDFGDDSEGGGWFEDGTIEHTYDSAGTYTVRLAVMDNDQNAVEETVTITVSESEDEEPEELKADFTWEPKEPKVGETVEFTGESTSPSDSTIISRRWTMMGDNEWNREGKNPTFSYSAVDDFNVCLAIRDDKGNEDSDCDQITVQHLDTEVIDQAFAKEIDSDTNQPVNRTDQFSSNDEQVCFWVKIGPLSGRRTVSFTWTEPDGETVGSHSTEVGQFAQTSESRIASHCLDTSDYQVELNMQDAGKWEVKVELDGEAIVTDHFTFSEKERERENQIPNAAFIVRPKDPWVGDEIEFFDQSSDNDTIKSYDWTFGDGSNSSKKNPTHFYEDAGNYEVCLTVIDNDGAFDKKCENIEVKSALTIKPEYEAARSNNVDLGLGCSRNAAEKRTGVVYAASKAASVKCTGSGAWGKIYHFFSLDKRMTVTVEAQVTYVGAITSASIPSFPEMSIDWNLDNRTGSKTIETEFDMEGFISRAVDIGLIAAQASQAAAVSQIASIISNIKDAVDLANKIDTLMNADESKTTTIQFSFDIPPGQHQIGIGVETTASGFSTKLPTVPSAFASITGKVDYIKVHAGESVSTSGTTTGSVIQAQPHSKLNIAQKGNDKLIFQPNSSQVDSVEVSILNLNGERVWSAKSEGHELAYNWRSEKGSPIANGVYFYKATMLNANGRVIDTRVGKLVRMR